MGQQVLVFNSGSSSLKLSLIDTDTQAVLLHGLAERLEHSDAAITLIFNKKETTTLLANADHKRVILFTIDALANFGLSLENISVVGHRVVHGGEHFSDSILITPDAITKIEQCNDLAPLHNPANIIAIRAVEHLLPNLPQVAVFDTAFHQTLPAKAFTYPIPYSLYKEHRIRRYGFHGTSHRYVMSKCIQTLQLNIEDSQLISVHLGNGCSATAILNGKSVDTTMGLTPLEGLMMGTRSGDVDPSLHQFLAHHKAWSLDKITQMLNRESGLLGLSELSNDMRTLLKAKSLGNQQATLAIDVFCFRLARQIAGLAASLTRIDALIFTGGIGENAAHIRAQVLENLTIFSFQLNAPNNANNGVNNNGIISHSNGPCAIVINTDEEWMIVQDCLQLTN